MHIRPRDLPAAGSLPSPTGAALSPDGNFVYVTSAYDGNLLPTILPCQKSAATVIQTSDNTAVAIETGLGAFRDFI